MADRFPLIVDSSAQQLQELAVGDNLNLASSGLINADNIQTSGLNVGVMTATSFIGDGSQLTNLPAAGSSTELTASGTLADGSKVIVNADGTVSVAAMNETTGPGAGSAAIFESASTSFVASAFDSSTGKVVIAYDDVGNSEYGTAVVGTVSGDSITFGTPVVFESGGSTAGRKWVVYDPNNQKVVISYVGGSSYVGRAIVGTVSGTSISFGSSATFSSAAAMSMTSVYDSANQKVVISYTDVGNSNYAAAVVGTVSGTSISFGTPVTISSAAGSQYMSSAYDSSNGKVVVVYSISGTNDGVAFVGTVSGTSISFGSPVTFNSSHSYYTSTVYDSTNNKIVIAYQDTGNSYVGTAIVGTVSGTSISFGSPTVFEDVNLAANDAVSAIYDPNRNEVVIVYNTGSSIRSIIGTVSGNSISFGNPNALHGRSNYPSTAYDSSNNKVVIAFQDRGNTYGTAKVFNHTGFTLPSVGSESVFESAAIRHVSAAYDSSNQKVVITYRDDGNSYYGTAVVGTVSGTSISFGTPVVFESATTQHTSTVFDPTNNKIVIAYSDNGNSARGTAVVGTVSGDSISFGSPVVFRSASCTYISAVYDASAQKVVVAYQDGGNSDRGYTSVLTVSGTSVTYGSYRQFESGRVDSIGTAYDSVNEKVVIAYQDGGSSSYGTAIVAYINPGDTENNFGSPTIFEYADTYDLSAAYDSSNQKVVITYKDGGNSYAGTAVVGEVSGTSISFGTPVVFANSPGSLTNNAVIYDSSEQKVVITYEDAQNSSYGTAIVGTVSGTSISFGFPSVFNTGTTYYSSPTYDSTNNKVVIPYKDNGNSGYGTAITFSPKTASSNLTAENYIGISDGAYSNGQTATVQLIGSVDDAQSSLTPGQKYYLQDDGTLSTTAGSPSVLAGTAIAATKLLIKK